MKRLRGPLTSLGVSVFGVAVFAFLVGWVFGWIELIVLATACSLALLMAVPFVIGRTHLVTERHLLRTRVTVGERANVIFRFTNPRSSRSRRRVLRDLLHSVSTPWRGERTIEVPALSGGETATADYDLPLLTRGCYEVGPAVISRSDPLHLMRRDVAHTDVDTLWVHPRFETVSALPIGFAKDLEGPTSDTSPAGDVSFHSLREYSVGDDVRHIHWLSTARTGRAMVRHYVDNRRPHLAVLLDTSASCFGDDEFEVAVEVVASLAVSSAIHHEPITVWAGRTIVSANGLIADRDTILDQLSLVRLGHNIPLAETAAELVRSERGISAVALVTGHRDSADLLDVVGQIRRRARPLIIRVWAAGNSRIEPIPHAHVVDVDSLSAFVAGWTGVVR